MTIPTPWTVLVRRFQSGATDPLGNPAKSWGNPEPLLVHGIQPGAMAEPGEPGRDADEVLWSVLAPAGSSVESRDKVILPGMPDEFDVIGHPKDYTRGPWANPVAGIVVELGHVEG